MTKRMVSGLILSLLIAAPALAGDLPPRTPGLWQSTATAIGPDGQPIAGAVNVVTVSCVDTLNDQKFFTNDQNACTSLRISGSGNKFVIDGACTRHGQTLNIHETLLYSGPQALQLTANYNGSEGMMTVTSQLQWQGDCLPGMQPGDEGTLAGSNFTLTDNINDSLNQ